MNDAVLLTLAGAVVFLALALWVVACLASLIFRKWQDTGEMLCNMANALEECQERLEEYEEMYGELPVGDEP